MKNISQIENRLKELKREQKCLLDQKKEMSKISSYNIDELFGNILENINRKIELLEWVLS